MITPEILQYLNTSEDHHDRIAKAMSRWDNWLRPVFSHSPAGNDPAYDDDFQAMHEEINKLSGTDADRLCQLAEALLCNTAKDIRVITWYSLARLSRDGERGLADGLLLLAAMIKRYGAALHPRRPNARKAAIEWLNSEKVTDALSRWPEVEPEDASLTAGALMVLHHLTQQWTDSERPSFAGLCSALQQRMEGSGGTGAMVPQNSSEAENQRDIQGSSALPLAPVRSGRDLLDQSRLLGAWLAEQPGGWLASHRLMKSVRWDTVNDIPPMDASSRTRLNPPKAEYRAQLRRLYLQQRWVELVEYATQMFCEGVNHFCLDVQWYLWQGLSRAGLPWETFAGYITADLSLLLERLPGLENLAWNDGTPFADEVTLCWINEQVKGDKQVESVTVASSEGDEILALESEAMEKGDSEGAEAALGWLQSRTGTASLRGRWLVRLLMARIAEQYGRHEMALHLLGELTERAAQMTMADWEPELIFEVLARRLRLLRIKSTRSESDKARLTPEMDKLIAGMIQIDPARAMVLCN